MSEAATATHERRASWLLALGATLGLGVAAAHLLVAPGPGRELPEGAVARVEEAIIRDETYRRLVAALASDRRTPLTAADRERVLDRLIEEELLVQHAVALGLVGTDRRVRADMVSAVLASINASADGYTPEPDEIEAFYATNQQYFARPARVRVRHIFVAHGDEPEAARTRAQRASERLRAGEPLERVRGELGDEVLAPVPDAPLPPAKLREYLGPSALEAALALPPGGVSDPVETPQGFHVLLLLARSESQAQPLESVRPQVIAEMKRREGDRRLRERLDELRADADVVVTAELP
ncbi:MAG: peptidyl-prolyl cis-trans isomerase [Deltaproteobacteria bacterium]|nr:peptidyl-prolyl cis-trans isomerase [Deltaproteobacteria bacterium]